VEGVTVYASESIAPLYADRVGATVPRERLDAVIDGVQFYGFYDFGRFYNLAPGEFNQTVDSFGRVVI
jgi:hypothetical protein